MLQVKLEYGESIKYTSQKNFSPKNPNEGILDPRWSLKYK